MEKQHKIRPFRSPKRPESLKNFSDLKSLKDFNNLNKVLELSN